MGKPTGFMEWDRKLPVKREKTERVHDYREFMGVHTGDGAKEQAGRCIDCGVPFCHQGCPLGNQIPDWNEHVYRGRWEAAFRNLSSTNNFPEFTGRLCPAPCEAACVLTINDDPVTIEQIEKEIIERAFAEGWVKAQPPAQRTGRKMAVVGSGPAGLAAAAQLNRAGHLVTVLERDDRVGGLLRYGIPDFKMEKWVIDRRVAVLEEEGVVFRTRVPVGQNPTWDRLKSEYDAVVIATGARTARDLQVPGRELPGVHFAMDFLEQQNRVIAGDLLPEQVSAEGKHVVILGGGDTGSDCVGTSHRHGAASVTQIELMPAPPELRDAGNPWPQWPMIFRTSSSQEEGGEREFAVMTKSIGGDGKVEKLNAVRVEVVGGKVVEVPGSEHEIPCDLLLLAMGFTGPETTELSAQLGVELDARGNVKVDQQFRTSVDGVWAAGDARKGASLIVWAIADGRETARFIDESLGGGLVKLHAKGMDLPFGGR